MNADDIAGSLAFIRHAEKLKDVLRFAYTSSGRQESTAEHTWRLCLMAMVFEKEFADADIAKLLKLCVIHDLGEAISGDIPAVDQQCGASKAVKEREDFITLLAPLSESLRAEFLALWDEYESAGSPEALIVKGLDKLETIIQHNQGRNPPAFDYAFNLSYGAEYTARHPLLDALRTLVDQDTERHVKAAR